MLKLNIKIILLIQYTSFKVKKTSKINLLKGADIIIWTTTPWTIPANKALAYNTKSRLFSYSRLILIQRILKIKKL